jgi:hypothetical protein
MSGQRFFVAKTYVTDDKACGGITEWGWHVFVVKGDGAVVQLDDYYDTEAEALADAAARIGGWQNAEARARYDI